MLHQSDNNVDVNTFLTFILVLLVSYIIWSYYFSVRINIPGPTPWPIVGNIPNFLGVRNVGKRFLEFQKQYGDMVLLRLGSQPFVVFFGYKAVHEALITNGEKTKFRPSWLYLFRTVFPKLTGEYLKLKIFDLLICFFFEFLYLPCILSLFTCTIFFYFFIFFTPMRRLDD